MRVATVPIVPRTHSIAVLLSNDQLAIVGGDEPSDLIELFTAGVP